MAALNQIYMHCVWSNCQRKPIIRAAFKQDLYKIIVTKSYELKCVPIAIGGVVDHIHFLFRLNPSFAPSRLIGEVKGASNHAVNHVISLVTGFRWQQGFGAFSLSIRSLDDVAEYVRNQKKRHAVGNLVPTLERITDDH